MRRNDNLTRCSAMLLSGSLAIGLVAWTLPTVAQEKDKDDAAKQAAFAKDFWEYLQEAEYQEKWKRWPGHEEEFQKGTSPHGEFLKVYVNDKVTDNLKDPPLKSIIVKENYNKDKELVAITPMYRASDDYDPEHNNWYWAKYKPDGSLFEADGMKLSGKIEGCINCHRSAKGDDFIFTNDK